MRRAETAVRSTAMGLFAFLVAFFVAGTLAPVQNSDAAQEIEIKNSQTDYYIIITLPDDKVSIPVEASPGGQLAAGKTSVSVKTNSPTGYKLYLSTTGLDNNIYKDGAVANSSLGYFSPISGSLDSPAALTQNTWGFTMDEVSTPEPATTSTWAAVPKSDNPVAIATASSANTATDGTSYDVYYGVNASTALPAGDYSTTVTYTAISEGVNHFESMQEFTAEECNNMSTDSSINLTDSRDGKYYRISKLKDGHCWMTQNLALDGTDASGNVRTLLPSDSNVTTSRKLAENIESGTEVAYDEVQIFSGIAENATTSDTTGHSIVSDEKYGNLYNWNAATAGVGKKATTDTVTESICPKGWRLPDNAGDFSWANLMGKYGYPTANTTNAQDGKTYEYIEATQGAPLHIPLAGYYYNGSVVSQGINSSLWSRTVHSSITYNAYHFSINASNGNFYPQSSGNKNNVISVRCVFGGQSDEIMQNFTTAQCTALTESTAQADNRKTMIDSRDGKFYKISKLADGNCWMVQNLALDGMDGLGAVRTLTTSDSNVTQNRTLAKNIENGTATAYDVPQIFSGVANDTTKTKTTEHTIISDEPYGNLYNWNAATATVGKQATTGSVAESICPKGWRLPDNTGSKSYSNLLSVMGYPGENKNNTQDGNTYTYMEAMQGAPLYIPLTGAYTDSSVANQGRYSHLWSRTVYSSTNTAYNFYFNADSGYFYPRHHSDKCYGFTVRCILGE